MRKRSGFGRLATILSIGGSALWLSACGGGDGGDGGSASVSDTALPEPTSATLILDFVPNAAHVGIYRAVAAGYYEDQNIDLRIVEPNSTLNTLKQIDEGRADFGIADGLDVGQQIADGRDAQAIMAVVERPLGGLITLEKDGINDPAKLEGKRVGITGVPSDSAILDTVVSDSGGNPKKVDVVTVGFNGAQRLEDGKVSAFTGFPAADGAQVEVDGFPTVSFPLDEYGGPTYPGLVVFSTGRKIAEDPALMRAFVAATAHGYTDTLEDPEASMADLLGEVPSLDSKSTKAQLDNYLELFQADAPHFGELVAADLDSLSAFMLDSGLARQPIPAERYGTNQFVPGVD